MTRKLMRHATAKAKLAAYSEADADGCLLYRETSLVRGYGLVCVGGRRLLAHRVAYEEFKGPIPDGLQVRHLCHKRRCVNPEHLALGTQKDNEQDKRSAKRHLFGERHHKAKLKEDQVLSIRADKRSGSVIAAEYGIRRETANAIRAHRTWRHI